MSTFLYVELFSATVIGTILLIYCFERSSSYVFGDIIIMVQIASYSKYLDTIVLVQREFRKRYETGL